MVNFVNDPASLNQLSNEIHVLQKLRVKRKNKLALELLTMCWVILTQVKSWLIWCL